VFCAQCNKQIPKNVERCPHCGVDTTEAKNRDARMWRFGFVGGAIGAAAGLVLGLLAGSPSSLDAGICAGIGAGIGVGVGFRNKSGKE